MNYIILIAGLLNMMLGLLVLFKNPKNKINISFAVYASTTSLLCLFDFVFRLNPTIEIVRLAYATAIFIPAIAYTWTNFLMEEKRRIILGIFVYSSAFVLAYLTIFTAGIVESVNYLTFLGYRGELGSLFLPYSLYILIVSLYILTKLYINQKKLEKRRRTQIRLIILGFSLYLVSAALFSLLLPIINNYNLTMLDAPSSLFFVGFSAYAIVKHRFFDIKLVVVRSLSYALLVVILAAFYAGSVLGLQAIFFPSSSGFNLAEGAVRTFIAVVMVFLFQPLRSWLNKVTDSIFFKESYNVEDLLDRVAHTVSSTIIMIEMLYKTLDLITSQIKITRGLMLIFDDANKILETQSVGYKEGIRVEAKDAIALVKDGVIAADELSENSKLKNLLAKYNVSVAVPLKTDNGVEGLLMLGEKQSGDMFSQSDLKVFEIIAPEIAVAVTNAKSYERIERFNVTLRQEIKKATSELEKKNEQLRALDKAKDEFISMASHQLRTPLTAIKGYLSMLLEGDAGEIKVSQYDFVNEAFQGANRMVGLINDLLNVSRMETGRFFLEPKEVDMVRVVNEEVKQLNKQAKEKGLKLEIKIKGKIPKVWVDETKVRQVVMNFADNAIYYTTSGSVMVTLEANKKDVIYKVKDTGIGVPKAQQKQLFEKFFRADNARHVRPDGTGLGIYLAKKVVDDHGGKLIFDSVEGKGSTFGFELPIKSALKIKRISAPGPRNHTNTPQIGELAAGIGVDPKTLEATQIAGVEPPFPDSSDKEALENEVAEIK